jgi:hypothetical protein
MTRDGAPHVSRALIGFATNNLFFASYIASDQAGVVAQGLLQHFTIRPGIPPSEFVVTNAQRRTLPHYLLDSPENGSRAKFIADRQDTGSMQIFRLAA